VNYGTSPDFKVEVSTVAHYVPGTCFYFLLENRNIESVGVSVVNWSTKVV
jgi:hypothetical protein